MISGDYQADQHALRRYRRTEWARCKLSLSTGLPAAFILLFCLVATDALASNFRAGQRLYGNHCQACHGANGVALVPNAPNFSRGEGLRMPDKDILRSIKYGKKSMPGFAGILREKDMLDVVAFVRGFWR